MFLARKTTCFLYETKTSLNELFRVLIGHVGCKGKIYYNTVGAKLMQISLDTLKMLSYVPSQDMLVLESTSLLRGRISFTIQFSTPSD